MRCAGGVATALLLVCLAVPLSWPVALASHLGRHANQDFPPHPGATPIVIGFPTATPTSKNSRAALSPSQQQTAVQVALKSPYVRTLIRHQVYHVAGATPWTAKGVIAGALVRLRFSHAVNLTGRWLALSGRSYNATYKRVGALRVYVDVKRQRVLAVVPKTI
jgi:hypothetical protein